jgi:hypothetical protein
VAFVAYIQPLAPIARRKARSFEELIGPTRKQCAFETASIELGALFRRVGASDMASRSCGAG